MAKTLATPVVKKPRLPKPNPPIPEPRSTTPATTGAWSGAVRETTRRNLRVYAFDPMRDRFGDPLLLSVPFEHLEPGPRGRLLEVVDLDAPTDVVAPPVDLNDPEILISGGLTPSETDRRFHAQMVYGVAMRTVELCERGLGRTIVWSSETRLRLVPHAFIKRGADFDPNLHAVFFGYFPASQAPGPNLAGQTIYACASFDSVAHAMAHAVFETIIPAKRCTSPDATAVVESVADLVALFVRASEPQVLTTSVRVHGPYIKHLASLFEVTPQIAAGAGTSTTTRTYPIPVDVGRFRNTGESPRHRSEILTSIVCQATLRAYQTNISDLVGLAEPSGRPETGWVHPDLVARLANLASTLARDVLSVVVGSLDLLPPSEPRFVDVIRAIVTVDRARFGTQHRNFRAALIEEALAWGVLEGLDSLDESSVAWPEPSSLAGVIVPHAADLMMAAARELELRRLLMSSPPDQHRLDELKAMLNDNRLYTKQTVRPAIQKWAEANHRTLGFSKGTLQMGATTGCFWSDPTGAVRGRICVQLLPEGTHDAGVTLWCDSGGTLRNRISKTPPMTQPTQKLPNAELHTDLVSFLKSGAKK
jgi:hypothetical protein